MANKALATVPHTDLPDVQTFQTMTQMAGQLFKSGLLPSHIKNEQAAFAVVQKGRELGLPPMYALSNIVVINGKPTANAECMLALIYRDHGDDAIQFSETTNQRCVVAYKRAGWSQYREFAFTIEDAKLAGLAGSATWTKYPAAMLRARCVSAVARLAFPDSIAGLYTGEELGADVEVDSDGAPFLSQPEPPQTLDETEPAPTVNSDTGEVVDGEYTEAAPDPVRVATLTQPDVRRIKDHSTEKHVAWDAVTAHAERTYGVDNLHDLTKEQGRELHRWITQQARQASQGQPLDPQLNPTDEELEGGA